MQLEPYLLPVIQGSILKVLIALASPGPIYYSLPFFFFMFYLIPPSGFQNFQVEIGKEIVDVTLIARR